MILIFAILFFQSTTYAKRIEFVWNFGVKTGYTSSNNSEKMDVSDKDISETASYSRDSMMGGFYFRFTHKGAEYTGLQIEINLLQKGFNKGFDRTVYDPYNLKTTDDVIENEKELYFVQDVFLNYISIPLLFRLDLSSFWDEDGNDLILLFGFGVNILIGGKMDYAYESTTVFPYYERMEIDAQLGIVFNYLKQENFSLFIEGRYIRGAEQINKIDNHLITINNTFMIATGIDISL